MDLRHHIGADRAVVNGRDIVGIHLVIAGMFFGNVRPKRLLIDACVTAQVVSNTEPVFVGNIPIAFDEHWSGPCAAGCCAHLLDAGEMSSSGRPSGHR